MALKLSGLTSSAATIQLSQGGVTGSASTGALPATPEMGSQPSLYVGGPKEDIWGGTSASIGIGGVGSRWGDYTYPRVFVKTHVVNSVSGRQLHMGLRDSEFRAPIYIGCRADVYRLVNGELELVRSSEVVDGNLAVKHTLTFSSVLAFSQPEGYAHRLTGVSKSFHNYYFGVAAVDAGGQIGDVAWSSAYNPGDLSVSSGSTPVNTNGFNLPTPFTEGGPLSAPASVTVTPDPNDSGLIQIDWAPVGGAVGYIPFVGYDDPATHPVQTYLELADDGGDPVQGGDMAIFTRQILNPSVDMVSARAINAYSVTVNVAPVRPDGSFLNTASDYSYAFRRFDTNDPAPDPLAGTTYLHYDIQPDVIRVEPVKRFWHASANQSFYSVLDPNETYRFTMWARASRATDFEFNLSLQVPSSSEVRSLSTAWQKYTFEGSPAFAHTGGPVAWFMRLSTFGEPGIEVDIAGIRVEQLGVGYNNFSPERKAQLTPGTILRDHTLIKDNAAGSDVEALTNPGGCSSKDTTLDTFLYTCLDAQAIPWIQVEWYHRSEDWADIMAYLAAPVSSGHPMALKRAAQGREAPWTDAFERVLFEFGNETWNTLSDFRVTPELRDAATNVLRGGGEVYGAIARRAALAMENSPYWSPKMEWILGGRADSDHGVAAARFFRRPCKVGIANYNGGWDVGINLVSETESSYQAVLGVVPSSTGPGIRDQIDRLEDLAVEPGSGYVYGDNLRSTCYEAGPGYQLSGLNGASVSPTQIIFQEVVMKSRAAATGTLDTFCEQARAGFSEGNYFVLGFGDYWKSAASKPQGGGIFPSWKLLQILQAAVAPARALSVSSLIAQPLTVLDNNGQAVPAQSIFAYGFENLVDSGRKVFVVGNRSVTDTIKPRLLTPLTGATGCTVWSNIGDYREHNRYPVGQRLATVLRVDGAGQVGTTLAIKDVAFNPSVNETFTIAGDATTYTVTDVSGFNKPDGAVSFTPTLAVSPPDNAVITWSSVVDGFGPDPLCVDIQIPPVIKPVPSNPGDLVIDEDMGATAAGLPPGCCVIIQFDGAT